MAFDRTGIGNDINTVGEGSCVHIAGVTGSNPVSPTNKIKGLPAGNTGLDAAKEPIRGRLIGDVPDVRWVKKQLRIPDFRPGQIARLYEGHQGKRGFIYVFGCAGRHKIGVATNVEKRFKTIDSNAPFDLTIEGSVEVSYAGMTYGEGWLHQHFQTRHAKGEWFDVPAEEIIEMLPAARIRASVYDWECALWFEEFGEPGLAEVMGRIKRDPTNLYAHMPDPAIERAYPSPPL